MSGECVLLFLRSAYLLGIPGDEFTTQKLIAVPGGTTKNLDVTLWGKQP